jgi:hypothetical protein
LKRAIALAGIQKPAKPTMIYVHVLKVGGGVRAPADACRSSGRVCTRAGRCTLGCHIAAGGHRVAMAGL